MSKSESESAGHIPGVEWPAAHPIEFAASPEQVESVVSRAMEQIKGGPIERALTKDIQALEFEFNLSGTLIQSAFALARCLDAGAGLSTAAVARELRETVKTLRGLASDDARTKSHADDLSTPVQHSPDE
jgi:hypothetical protein